MQLDTQIRIEIDVESAELVERDKRNTTLVYVKGLIIRIVDEEDDEKNYEIGPLCMSGCLVADGTFFNILGTDLALISADLHEHALILDHHVQKDTLENDISDVVMAVLQI